MTSILVPNLTRMTVRREGTRVLLLVDGKLLADWPWDAAKEIAKAIRIQALRAEEQTKAEQIIMDQAILTRIGAPVGLTDRPDFQRAAANEAAYNSDLRRYIRGRAAGGLESRAIVGVPTIRRSPGKSEK